MKELVELIAKELVEFPEDVYVDEVEKDSITVLQLNVNDSDKGKVIGKRGRIAKAIRTVVKAASLKENTKVNVEIV
ncbi:MAG: KH domain-containing protein [Clostridium sp.]|jgi:predicted RNA-binding protein YlqC (UPF0109 family)|nr:KH domain-containing protein [Clostridium sp.]